MFTDLAIGREPRAALPRPEAAATRPLRAGRSWCVLSGDAPSPGLLERCCREKTTRRRLRAQSLPRTAAPGPVHPEEPCPCQGSSQIDGRRGADRAKLTSLPVASSGLASGSAQVNSEPAFPCVLPSLEGRARALGDAGQSMPAFNGTHAVPQSSCGASLSPSGSDRVTRVC